MTDLDATLTAKVEAYRRDPHRQAEVEMKYRVSDTSLEFANANFQNVARKGQLVEVNNEPHVEVTGYDGYAASTAQTIISSKQQFTVNQSAKWDVKIYEVDSIQTEDDIRSLVLDNATYQGARYMARQRFQAIKDANTLQLGEIDISSGGDPDWQSQTQGDKIIDALFASSNALRSQGIRSDDLKAALPAIAASSLVYAGKLQNSTEGQNQLNARGEIGTLVNARLFDSIDTPKTEADYNMTTVGDVAVGDHVITVDAVLDGAGTPAPVTPLPQDYFVDNSKTYRILAVSKTDTAAQFRLTLDRAVEVAITDNTVLTTTGYTHEHIIYASGKPLASVVQRNFGMWAIPMQEGDFSQRLKGLTLFGNFITQEKARQCIVTPVKVRDYTTV